MSDYKFNVGDKVKVESLDFWSVENMKSDIGKIGKIVFKEKDEDKIYQAFYDYYVSLAADLMSDESEDE